MPLPLLLVPILIGATWGAKKTVDAARDFSDAKKSNEKAKWIYEAAENSLDGCRQEAQSALEALGYRKKSLYQDGVIPFVKEFSRIKNVNFREIDAWDDLSIGDFEHEIPRLEEVAWRMEEALGGGTAALGSGALAGLATYGSVGVLGTASTGTAIGGLSGAAATNATLAWLGGGALTAGGYGMAGGAVVLGGIVAAPVLLVGGLVLAHKAEEAKEKALASLAKARTDAEAMKDAEVATRTIGRKAADVDQTLLRLHSHLAPDLEFLRTLVQRETDYLSYSHADKKRVCRVASIAVTAKNLLEAPLLDEQGAITRAIREKLRQTRGILDNLDAMQHPGAMAQ